MLYPTPALQLQMTRQPDLLRRIWRCLNEIDPAALLGEGRVYGGGLHKLGPKELAKVSLAGITDVVPTLTVSTAEQLSLFNREVA